MKRQEMIFIAVLCVLAVIIGILFYDKIMPRSDPAVTGGSDKASSPGVTAPQSAAQTPKPSEKPETMKFTVEFSGAVKSAGKVSFTEPTTLLDGLNFVGIVFESDVSELELESALYDGQVVDVPYRSMLPGETMAVNLADKHQLMRLGVISEYTAGQVEKRLHQGHFFLSLEEFKDYCKLSDENYAKIEKYLTLF
ncbi:MAG: hypothetical protein ACOX88_01500 [Christensenellales bacterium]